MLPDLSCDYPTGMGGLDLDERHLRRFLSKRLVLLLGDADTDIRSSWRMMLLLCRSPAETAALLRTGVERHFLSNAGNGLDQDAFTVASPVGQRVEIAGFQARDWHGDDARILSDLTLEGETDSQRALAWSLPFLGEKISTSADARPAISSHAR